MVNIAPPQDGLTPFQRRLRGLPPVDVPPPPSIQQPAPTQALLKLSANRMPTESVAARALKAALKINAPLDLVETNLEEAEKVAAEKDLAPEKLTPVLAKWYAKSPHHIAVTKADVKTLQDLERIYYRKDDPLRKLTDEEVEGLAKRMGERAAKRDMESQMLGAPSAFTDEATAASAYTADAKRKILASEEYVTGKGKAGAFAAPGSVTSKFPFSPTELVDAGSLFSSMKAVQNGTDTDEDRDNVFMFGRQYTAAAARGQTFGGKVFEGIAALPGFAAEFAMTGGAYRAGKAGAEMALRKVLQKVLSGRALGAVATGAGVVAGGVAQTAAQAAISPSLHADALKRMTPGIEITPDEEGKLKAVIADPGDDVLPALTKAFGARFVENLSERSGLAIGKLIAPVKAAVTARWLKAHPGKSVTDFLAKVSEKTGWHGPIEEFLEERVGEGGRALLGIEEYKAPSGEDMAAEILTFLAPTTGAALYRAAFSKSKARQNRDFFKAVQKSVKDSKVSSLAPEALEDLVGRLAQNGEQDYAYVPSAAWTETFTKLGKDPRAEALALGVSEESFDLAMEAGHDLQLPMAPFAVRVLKEDYGSAFIPLARTEPSEDTLEDAGKPPKEVPAVAQEAAPAEPAAPASVTPEEAGIADANPQEWSEIEARAKLADQHIKEAADSTQALMTFFPDRHMEAVERAKGSARQAFMAKATDAIRRKRMVEYREERAATRAEVEADVNSRKEYVALSMLKNGTLPSGAPAAISDLKLSREALKRDFEGINERDLPSGIVSKATAPEGQRQAVVNDQIKAAEGRLAAIQARIDAESNPAKKFSLQVKADDIREQISGLTSIPVFGEGVHPDDAAEMLGYSSGSELLVNLIDAEYLFPRETLIEQLTEARMAEKHQELQADPSRAHEEAERALHNTERSKLLVQDLKHLISEEFSSFKGILKKLVGKVPRLEEVTKWAQTEVRKKTFRTLHPGVYRQGAKTASRKALDAFLKGDFQEAFNQRLLELKNNELAIAAQELQTEAKAVPKFMRRFQKRTVRQSLAKAGGENSDYLGPVDEIIERFEFSPVSVSKVEKRQSLLDWYNKEVAAGRSPVVPEKLLKEAGKTNWKDVKLSDLFDIKRSVENIAHLAKTKNKLLTSKEKKEFDELVKSLVHSMEFYRTGETKKERRGSKTAVEILRQKLLEGVADMRKFSNIVQELDGGKDGGAMAEALTFPMNKAQEREQDMGIKGYAKLFSIFDVYSRKERRKMNHREFIPEINDSLSMWDRMSIALNWGNVDNQEALMLGEGWSREQVEKILSGLSARDLKVVQEVWDHMESYWPEVKGLSERVDGLPPEKVEAKPFTVTTSDGKTVNMKGGYYPLKYEPDAAHPHATPQELVDQSMRGRAWRASTRQDHRKEREGSGGRKVRRDLQVISEHERDVIHDITHYEWLLDANKLLRNPQVAEAIKGRVGAEHYDELLDTVNAIALNNRQTVDTIGRVAEGLARKTRAATLVFNVATVLKQYLGLSATAVKIGPTWTAKGLLMAGVGTARTREVEEWMAGLSTFMKNRRGNQDRDQADAMKDIFQPGGEPGAFGTAAKAVEKAGFSLIGATQWHVDRATWLGAYLKYSEELGLDKAGSEEERNTIEDKVVSMADQAVRDSQGSGLLADLPTAMRTRGTMRLLTLFRTFAVSQLNLFASKALNAKQRPSAATISQAATAFISLYVIPSMLFDYARQALVGGGDDEDYTAKGIAKKVAATGAKDFLFGIPLFGEIAPTIDRVFGEGGRDYRGPSGLALVAEFMKLAHQAGQAIDEGEDQLDVPLLRSAVRAGGIAVPGANAIDKLIGGYLSWEEGEAELPAMLLGNPKR